MTSGPAIEEGRAACLAGVPASVEALVAVAGAGRDRLAAVLLGRASSVRLPVPEHDRALREAVAALRYGAGANLAVRAAGPGACEVVSPEAHGGPVAGAAAALLTPRSAPRRRLGPAPVLILSTAGDPDLVRAALSTHLSEIDRFGHRGLRLAIVDDATPDRSAELDRIVAEAQQTTAVTLVRFPEHGASGGPGAKARFRSALGAGPVLDRVFSPSAYGSANAAFLLLGGAPLVWLEQDALPEVWHVDDQPGADGEAGDRTRIEWSIEAYAPDGLVGSEVRGSQAPSPHPVGLRRTPVDLVHVVDRTLYGPAYPPSYRALAPTWENTGYEAVSGRLTDPLRPRLCYFHLCGHTDFRARFSHHVLTRTGAPDGVRRELLAGGLDRFVVLSRPPEPVVVRSGAFTFGTAVGLHHDLPLPTPMMTATRQRLFDFTVAAILQASGECPAAIAGTALTHRRAATTTSGRGQLAPYVNAETLLWPMFHALVDALHAAPARCAEPPHRWLALIADAVAGFAVNWRPSATVTRRLWVDRLDDLRLASDPRLPDDVRAYLRELTAGGPDDWLALHRAAGTALREELTMFAEQLRLYATLGPTVVAAARRAVPEVWEVLGCPT